MLTFRDTYFTDSFTVIFDDKIPLVTKILTINLSELDTLKFLIYRELSYGIKFIYKNFNLWKVNITEEEESNLKSIKEDNIESGKKLKPNCMFEDYFKTKPEDENIHIIVLLVSTSQYFTSQTREFAVVICRHICQ